MAKLAFYQARRLRKCWAMIRNRERQGGVNYTHVVRVRPDVRIPRTLGDWLTRPTRIPDVCWDGNRRCWGRCSAARNVDTQPALLAVAPWMQTVRSATWPRRACFRRIRPPRRACRARKAPSSGEDIGVSLLLSGLFRAAADARQGAIPRRRRPSEIACSGSPVASRRISGRYARATSATCSTPLSLHTLQHET